MRLSVMAVSLVLVMSSCSPSNRKGAKSLAILNETENVAFEQLQTVRVMPSFISDKVDQNELRQTVLEEFGKIGVVHTPEDTSIEEMLDAQKKPFAILTLDVKEIATSDFKKIFPVISLSCRIYEEGVLALNNKQFMGNVWEKIYYVEVQPDQVALTQEIREEIVKFVREFSDNYYKVNSKSVKPEFYIGKNV